MKYHINDTSSYHINEIDSLDWELTICNALENEFSPCRTVLKKHGSFGSLLYDFLKQHIPFRKIKNIIEIGGGYGYLMRDFLKHMPLVHAVMVDISPLLLKRQGETLAKLNADFLLKDFFKLDIDNLKSFDIAILNENIGDFQTICEISSKALTAASKNPDPTITKVQYFFDNYSLKAPEGTQFNFNLGACEAVEKLCTAGIPYIYISEHSCEAFVPDEYKNMIDIQSTGNPERIQLKGHDEYTIKFSHLEAIAKKLSYRVKRGQYQDIFEIDLTDKINFILTGRTQNDEHEIIRHFIEDLFKYEFILLSKN